MENRIIEHEGRNESAPQQRAAAIRQAPTSEVGDAPLSGEELHLLLDFFRLLDSWERQEVAQ